jgi:hypothetical protein
MGWRDRLNLTVGMLIALLPFAVNLILLLRRKRLMRAKLWRFWLTTSGLVLSLAASFPAPLFYLSLELPGMVNGGWALRAAGLILTVAIMAGVVAIGLLGFGRGRVRWLGISMTLASMSMLYVTLLGVSD